MTTPDDQILASKALVKHLIGRVRDVPDWTYWCGFATQSQTLLVEAAAALFEKTITEIRVLLDDTTFGDRRPRHEELEDQRDELQERVAVLERKVRALGGEP